MKFKRDGKTALSYHRFKDEKTGREFYLPAGKYGRYLNAVKKLVSYVHYNLPRYYITHVILTLTLAAEEVPFEHLNRVTQFITRRLHRAGSDFKYIAVKEIQIERFKKYGEKAVHYHLLCVYSKPYVFPSSQEIAGSWRLGFVKIRAPKLRVKLQSIVNYLGKYIGKGYEYESMEFKKTFTSSQFPQIYKLSANRLAQVIYRFGKDRAEDFVCTYRKVYLVGYEEMTVLGMKVKKVIKNLLMEFSTDWSYMGVCDEPF